MSAKTKSQRLCPKCGSADLAPIIYGLPGPEAFEELERGDIVLGGCLVSSLGDDPTHACKACGVQFIGGAKSVAGRSSSAKD